MLQFIRAIMGSKVGSVVAKILFFILILAFGSWGVDDFLRQRPTDEAVITVGSQSVSRAEFQRAVQREIERARQQGLSLTVDELRNFGLLDRITNELVDNAVLRDAARDQHIEVSPAQILQAMQAEPAFRGADGKFDPRTAKAVLAANGLSEQEFESDLARRLAPSILGGPTTDGAAPALLTDMLFKIRQETRIAEVVKLAAKDASGVAPADATAIKDYYDHHPDAFTAPEYRSFQLLALKLETVAAGITPSDDQLKDAYQQRADEFKQPEKRDVLQMLLPDQKAADAARDELAAGKDFLDVAKRLAHQDAATVDLGWVARKALPTELGNAVFAAQENAVITPVKSPFGYTLAKVTGIRPAAVESFDEAKPKLIELVRNETASEALYKLTSKVEDALAGGVDLAAVADQYGLKLEAIPATSVDGTQPDGTPLAALPIDQASVLPTVFATAQGQSSSLQTAPDGKDFYVVKVISVTPRVLRPFDTVKDKVRDALMAERRSAAVSARAKALAAEIKPGLSLDQIAARDHLTVTTTPPLLRTDTGKQAALPASAVSLIFKQKPGEAGTIDDDGDAYIVSLREIKAADPTQLEAARTSLRNELQQSIANETFSAFVEQLKERHPVDVHKVAIDQLYPATQP